MSNISIFGTLENVTDGALAKGTQIVGGRMSVATIAERDAIPAIVRKDGTEVYVTATKLTYRWNAAANAFEKVTYSQLPEPTTADNGKVVGVESGEYSLIGKQLPEPTASDNGKIVSVENGAYALTDAPEELPPATEADNGKFLGVKSGTYGLVSPNLYGGSGRRLIWSSESGADRTGEIGFNPIGKTFDVEFAIGPSGSAKFTCRFTCETSGSSSSPLETDIFAIFYPYSAYDAVGVTTTRIAGYYTAQSYFYRLINESESQYKFQARRAQNCQTTTVYNTSSGTETRTSTETVVSDVGNANYLKLYNLYLIEGTTAIENHTIVTSAWTALSGSAPYTYSATVTVTAEISETSIIELYNNNAVLFAKYGFAIGAVSGQNVTVYSIGQPTESVALTIQIGG